MFKNAQSLKKAGKSGELKASEYQTINTQPLYRNTPFSPARKSVLSMDAVILGGFGGPDGKYINITRKTPAESPNSEKEYILSYCIRLTYRTR